MGTGHGDVFSRSFFKGHNCRGSPEGAKGLNQLRDPAPEGGPRISGPECQWSLHMGEKEAVANTLL